MATHTRGERGTRSSRSQRFAKKLDVSVNQLVGGDAGSQAVSVRELRERFGVSRKLFSRVVGFSERAIAGWESEKPLSEACLQRVREIARLQEGLAGVMREEFVGIWLNTPNDAFGGLKPIEIIERGEIDRLWRMIFQLESGIPI